MAGPAAASQPGDNGLVIFIRRLPAQVSEPVLFAKLAPLLFKFQISTSGFELHKPSNRGVAHLFVKSRVKGSRFLNYMKTIKDASIRTLGLSRNWIEFEEGHKQDGGAEVRDQKFCQQLEDNAYKPIDEHLKGLTLSTAPQRNPGPQRAFPIISINCGSWSYSEKGQPELLTEYSNSTAGSLLVGHRSIVVLLFSRYQSSEWVHRLDFEWECIDTLYTQRGRLPSLVITCKWSPKIFRRLEPELQQFGLLGRPKNQRSKSRVGCIDTAHSAIVGTNFTYEFVFEPTQSLYSVQHVVEHIPEGPPAMRVQVHSRRPSPTESFNNHLHTLNVRMTSSRLPFAVKFQLMRMVLNGHLHPQMVSLLVYPLINAIHAGRTATRCAEALQRLNVDLPYASPATDSKELKLSTILDTLKRLLAEPAEDNATSHALRTNAGLAMVHHVQVTPTGIYLEGPEPEVTNRVLRRYSDHLDCFVRVTFCDEDGDRLAFYFDTSMDDVYAKFQAILNDSIPIAGKPFQFLGFSQSSLRSQTAWFMSPWVESDGAVQDAARAIEHIGDFSHFRSPARCAARIGQAFTDTNGFVALHETACTTIPDVERNDRVFSDGCGTMSLDVVEGAAELFKRYQMKEKPRVLQIRYQGCKGVLSLDLKLKPGTICIRPSMDKFPAKGTHDLEICKMADKFGPLYLNRSLIKVLEDLSVPHGSFIDLAKNTIARLQGATTTYRKAAKLLDDEHIGTALNIPALIDRFGTIGCDIRGDKMLCAVVEMAAFSRLRQMKYKGRIFVEKGIKLIGIMDETGLLREGQIHVAWIDTAGRRTVHQGTVVVSRSPCNHPGDVQLANAVDVPRDSPLRHLYNCVIFSQHGDRDLPSQLGGGDLDGDTYDIIWDPRLIPHKTRIAIPADYPRVSPVDIGRTVTAKDITKHFINFMQNDNIGMLANRHLLVSDRRDEGTFDSLCLAMSELMSTALDYPKTGIMANIKSLPRIDQSWKPDFMAPGPKVKIEDPKDEEKLALVILDNPVPDTDDPVVALDPDQRKTRYYESPKILGKLYRMIDEKGFYEQLQNDTKGHHREGMDMLWQVFEYALEATKGFAWEHLIDSVRDIRNMYEDCVVDICHAYALHSTHPLHEIEVVTGTVLGSTASRKLKDLTSEMKDRFKRDVAYIKERIRLDANGDEGESLPRSVACLFLAVNDPPRRMGKHGETTMWSWGYLAAGMVLEEIARIHNGRLKRYERSSVPREMMGKLLTAGSKAGSVRSSRRG